MYWKEAADRIKRAIPCKTYLQKSKCGNYICNFCGSGEGKNGTGAVKLYEQTNTTFCHVCKKYADVIELAQQSTGGDFKATVEELAPQAGIREPIEWDSGYHRRSTAAEDFAEPQQAAAPSFNGSPSAPAEDTAQPIEPPADYRNYYIACAAKLKEPAAIEYLATRGISYETAHRVYIGFDPAADPANAPGGKGEKKHPCPRIIIPSAMGHYAGRSIDPNTPASYQKMNNKGGKPGIFNQKALYDAETVFVTEGAFDALSLLEVGKAAIALNSTSNAELLLKQLEKKPTGATLIICLDNDEAGKKATETLRKGLNRLNISFLAVNICGSYNDPNEAMRADRAAFEAAINKATAQTAARPDNTQTYLDELMAGEIEKFKNANLLTGFSNLDARAKGLYPGLYVLAAISSLGKTTLALQTADNIAAAGHDVLFFSMEQSRLEMVSKSLARLTAQADMKSAVNALSIRQGYLPLPVQEAIKKYKAQTGERLSIIEGNFNCDIGFISDYIRRYINKTGQKPVVFIDYLQILQPAADGKSHSSKKDEIDLAVTELKRLSRELDLTIIVISSLNRANYMTPFAFESLKESGGIEYTADVVWGLQLACLDEELFDIEGKLKKKRKRIDEAKAETPRKIRFVCLKNRYGISHYEVNFSYYPEYDLFVPAADPAATAQPIRPGKKGA